MRKRRRNDEEPPRRRDTVAPDDFCEWWNPTGILEPSGASVGGHQDAERVWARKDPGRWVRRTYGITATIAWVCENYRREYYRWVDAERPADEPFVSIAATLEQQHAHYKTLHALLAQIGKPMPKEDKQPLPRTTEQLMEDYSDGEPIPF